MFPIYVEIFNAWLLIIAHTDVTEVQCDQMAEIKSGVIFSNSYATMFFLNSEIFQIGQNLTKYLGYFYKGK